MSGLSAGPESTGSGLNRRLGAALVACPMQPDGPRPGFAGHAARAARQLGLGILRLDAAALLDDPVRPPMAGQADETPLHLVRLAGRPSGELLARLGSCRSRILAVEVVLSEEAIADWRARPPAMPVPVRLAPAGRSSVGRGRQRACGFSIAELDRLTDLDLKDDGAFAGIVARLRPDEPVFGTLLRAVAAVSARELDLSVDLDLPTERPGHDLSVERRAAEAAFAAKALPDAEIVIEGLTGTGQQDEARSGLLDERFEPSAQGRAVQTINALPPLRAGGFAWSLTQPGGGTVHGYESEAGIELLALPGAAPLPEPALAKIEIPVRLGTRQRIVAVDLAGSCCGTARTTLDDGGRACSIDPPLPLARPLIVRLS